MFRSSPGQRRGFTLIELLVVIAIIAILIGLLVPAVQKVREAAARLKCENNLKQMGLACHMYNDSSNKLPPGWVVSTASAPNPGWSWATVIMPYIEQGNLYQIIDNGAPPNVTTPDAPPSTPLAAGQTPIPIYRCPSDPGPATNGLFANYATNNYVCNREVLGPDGNSKPTGYAVQSIPDGTSNTILIGERDSIHSCAAVYIRHNNTSASFEGRPGSGMNAQCGPPPNTGCGQRLEFASQHSGGANFVFCDGSVHFLSNSISVDPADTWTNFPATFNNYTFQNLIHPADGFALGNY
jgi:prepilin-type N-terminal cleavage/methylation domain-containing protein/prepilin-type processing-associated H-X9-DG protein